PCGESAASILRIPCREFFQVMRYRSARGWKYAVGGRAIVRLTFVVLFASLAQDIAAQQVNGKNTLFRMYVDNDFFAYRKEDGGYSNGLRFDLFYHRKQKPTSFLSNFLLKAGDTAI